LGFSEADAQAHEDEIEEVVVWGRQKALIGKALSASEGYVGYADLSTRPMLRVGELVEVIPGMIATQHSGSGKANQYFLRGFNLDHGTDFSAFVDGVPANQRSHGHGHGYLDLNFIIPETVEHVTYSKGPYAVDRGDFAIAGSSSIKTYDRFERPFANLTVGAYEYARIMGGASTAAFGGDLLFAGEAQGYDGPWILNEDLQKYSAVAKYTRDDGQRRFQIVLNGYRSQWMSTDQIPLRAVEEGYLVNTDSGLERVFLSRRGNIDPHLGGETTRASAAAIFQSTRLDLSAYAIHYGFDLFSNFTYFLADPIRGDQFQQVDNRWTFGGEAAYLFERSLSGLKLEYRIGGEFRYDDIGEISLFSTQRRERIGARRDDSVRIQSVAGFAESVIHWTPSLRMTLGARLDHVKFAVIESLISENEGSGDDILVSPKATLAWSASDGLELYANYGAGFHSNDVRGVVINIDPNTGLAAEKTPLLVKGRGAEIGLRAAPLAGLNVTAAGFWVDLDSELVFVGDAGGTERNDSTQRFGFEAEAFWRATDWLTLDISVTTVHARFSSAPKGQNRIPNAVEDTLAAGATFTAPSDFTATIRLRRLGSAPLSQDNAIRSDPTTTVNLRLAKKIGSIELGIDVLNLFDSKDNDITYFYESRLPYEWQMVGSAGARRPNIAKRLGGDSVGVDESAHLLPPPLLAPSSVEDIHFHPLEPRMVRLTIGARL
jgi:outer membrane receptor protein involved in Fe transport